MSLIDVVILCLLGAAVFAALRGIKRRGGTGCCQCSQCAKEQSGCQCTISPESRPKGE